MASKSGWPVALSRPGRTSTTAPMGGYVIVIVVRRVLQVERSPQLAAPAMTRVLPHVPSRTVAVSVVSHAASLRALSPDSLARCRR